MTPALTARFVTDSEGFRALGPEWDVLLSRSRSGSVFLTWGWLYSWWSCFGAGRSLRVCEVRDTAGALVGIGPFCIERTAGFPRLRCLTFLGTERVSSEYLDVIAAPDLEGAVLDAAWSALLADGDSWDFIRWTDMLESSAIMRHGGPRPDAALERDLRTSQICPYMPLAADSAGQLRAFGPNLRMNVRRKMRALERAGAEFAAVGESAPLREGLESLYRLHEKRWLHARQPGNFRDPRVRAFHHRLAESLGAGGHMRLYTLRRAGRTLAVLYTLQYGRTLSYYQAGYEPEPGDTRLAPSEYSPGFALLAHAILDGAGRGLGEFDFLRGPEAYKSRWTQSFRTTLCLTLVPRRNWLALGRRRLDRGITASKDIVKRLLRREAAFGGPTP